MLVAALALVAPPERALDARMMIADVDSGRTEDPRRGGLAVRERARATSATWRASACPSDIFARYHRLQGNDVLMVSGTDEHGTPVMVAADAEGRRRVSSPTATTRSSATTCATSGSATTSSRARRRANHYRVTQDIFRTLYEHGLHLRAARRWARSRRRPGTRCPTATSRARARSAATTDARGDQCDNCGNQLDPTDLIDPRSRIDGAPPEFRETKHLFLDLPAFADRLRELDRRPAALAAERPQLLARASSTSSSRGRSRATSTGASRSRSPGYEEDASKRIYVWFDAVDRLPLGGVEWAAIRGTPDAWREWWQNPDARHYYFMGKDNIVFHTVIWPSMLLGYGEGGELGAGRGTLQLPYDVVASEFLTMEGQQVRGEPRRRRSSSATSSSRYDPDPLRYFLTAAGPETQDTDFTWAEFVRRNNDELSRPGATSSTAR